MADKTMAGIGLLLASVIILRRVRRSSDNRGALFHLRDRALAASLPISM